MLQTRRHIHLALNSKLLILKNLHYAFVFAVFYIMSALRLCGVLVRNTAIPSQQQRLPIFVPIALKLKSLINAPKLQQQQQSRGFKNFGHKPTPEADVSKYFNAFLGIGTVLCLLDWRW